MAPTSSRATHRLSREQVSYAKLPLSFVVNQGQVNPRARFVASGQGFAFFLTRDEALLELSKAEGGAGKAESAEQGSSSKPLMQRASFLAGLHLHNEIDRSSCSRTADVIGLKLLGANREAKITGEEKLPGYSSYFIGNNPRNWHTHVPNYARVLYRQIYPGVDLVYYGRRGRLENDFMLAPGANPQAIRIGLDGVEAMHVDSAGDLVLKVSGGDVYLRQPHAYQGTGAQRRDVAVHYVLRAGNQVGFAVGRYDRRQKLVIDPVLTYSTYLGGNGGDVGAGIAIDSSGDAYVTGTTASLNFPTTGGGQTSLGSGKDIFVTKINPTGTAYVYSVLMGGGNGDTATGIAVDSSGNAYIVGYTSSTDFPASSGAFQTSLAGATDAFLSKLNANGTSLVYSTYLGGSGDDYARAVAVDSAGDAFVTGSTESTDFPTMNALQAGNDGGSDAFVTEFNPDGTALLYSTYLGGSGADEGRAIALDSSGNPYIAGVTFSADFPTQAPLQAALSGAADAFVTEINPETSSMVFSTYLGGSGVDSAQAIAVDSTGNIYLAGDTTSDNFPVTSGAYQSSNHGQGDAFVAKLSPGATQVVYATYLGGSNTDHANALALDSSGDAYVTGYTDSSNFPLVNAIQKVLGISGASSCGAVSCSDAFISELGPSGSLVYSTYLGGSAADSGQAIAVSSSGTAYVTGKTGSANFPVISGAPQSTFAGTSVTTNVFVAEIGQQDAPALALSPQELNFGNQALNTASSAKTVTLMNAGSSPLGITSITASGEFSQTNNCGTVLPAGGGTCTLQVTFTPTKTGSVTDQISISDDAHGSPQTITVTGSGVTSAGQLTPSPTSLSFPAVTIGNSSAPQTVQLVNTGTTSVTLTSINVSGDYSETNTCGSLPTVLNVGAACSASVTFTPKSTGSEPGSLTFEDDAANGPQNVTITGTGNPQFSLSTNVRSSVLLIGKQSTTFTVNAAAPSSFTGSITLACSTGTCTFNPSSIKAGQSSTLTVTGLSASSANPYNFSIKGTSGSQTASVPLSIFFQDFSLSKTPPSPPLATVTAGQSTTYKVTVTPSNGFNQVVLLSCSGLPQGSDATAQKPDTTCTFSPPALTLNGTSSTTSTLTINTTVESSSLVGPGAPRVVPPPGGHPEFKWWALLAAFCLMSTIFAIFWGRRLPGATPSRFRTGIVILTLGTLLTVSLAACNNYYYGPSTTPVTKGTPAGTYTISIIGTLGSNNSIKRATTVNLSVSP